MLELIAVASQPENETYEGISPRTIMSDESAVEFVVSRLPAIDVELKLGLLLQQLAFSQRQLNSVLAAVDELLMQ